MEFLNGSGSAWGVGAGFPVLTSWRRSRHRGIQAAEWPPMWREAGAWSFCSHTGRTQGRPQGGPEPLFWGHMGSSHTITYLVYVLDASCPASPFPEARRARTCLGNSPRPRGSGRAGVWLPVHRHSLLSHSSSHMPVHSLPVFLLSILPLPTQPSSHLPAFPCVHAPTQ